MSIVTEPAAPAPEAAPSAQTPRERPGAPEAVCFTAGPKGSVFGAGVIHAWLASDRKAPRVVAGVSTGAVSAVALQKCYRCLESGLIAHGATLERHRWEWFREYLEAVTDSPLSVIWKAIPDPIDFFADFPPVQDPSVRNMSEVDGLSALKLEAESRRHYYLLTKFGTWLANLPIRIGTVASFCVYWVRFKEGYGRRLVNPFRLSAAFIRMVAGAWWNVARKPLFISERSFGGFGFRPLFGWPVWLGSVWPFAAVIAIVAKIFHVAYVLPVFALLSAAGAVCLALFLYFNAILTPDQEWSIGLLFSEAFRHFFKSLDIHRGLLSPFELQRRLSVLFRDETLDPKLANGDRTYALPVCASLQQIKQPWVADSVSTVTALTAACAMPGVFPPVRMLKGELRNLRDDLFSGSHHDIVDGSAVRANPIPAFFDWCRRNKDVASTLESESQAEPRMHVVYSVPIDPAGSLADAKPPDSVDVVESARAALELQRRRDTRQEVRQTNFLAGLEKTRRLAADRKAPPPPEDPVDKPKFPFQIFADEIAPPAAIEFGNGFEPTRPESLRAAAQGCRASMEALYADRIAARLKPGQVEISCSALIDELAPRRRGFITGHSPGLPEICSQCERSLRRRHSSDGPPPGVIPSFGVGDTGNGSILPDGFDHLRGPGNGGAPRIVFLGSGGVFRGAFHIGVIAAMLASDLLPDLVVGASVGSLMGGALAAIAVADRNLRCDRLWTLASTFLHVDERIAVTRNIKHAAKQLGVRARDLHLSPSELRRMVLRGAEADAGYAASGAPPALVDAISRLFYLPYRSTSEIAAEFIAGHFTRATDLFLRQVRLETLSSLEIERFVIGTSLLRGVARKLLFEGLPCVNPNSVQPYHATAPGGRSVSIFCTTSFLNARASLVLGRDFLTSSPTWNFVEAALSSSAFPVAFRPVHESEVLPGTGRADRLFADGGMFDNLPFFPAIEILSAGQLMPPGAQSLTSLHDRVSARAGQRDLFIAAGLNASAASAIPEYNSLPKIKKRADELSVDSKIQTFLGGARMVQSVLEDLAANLPAAVGPEQEKYLDATVNAAVLKINPTDKNHINGTFAFCRATGMKTETVQRSIADGCFQTLFELKQTYNSDPTTHPVMSRSRMPGLDFRPRSRSLPPDGECPYFTLKDGIFRCPFHGASGEVAVIRNVCAADKAHQSRIAPLRPATVAPGKPSA